MVLISFFLVPPRALPLGTDIARCHSDSLRPLFSQCLYLATAIASSRLPLVRTLRISPPYFLFLLDCFRFKAYCFPRTRLFPRATCSPPLFHFSFPSFDNCPLFLPAGLEFSLNLTARSFSPLFNNLTSVPCFFPCDIVLFAFTPPPATDFLFFAPPFGGNVCLGSMLVFLWAFSYLH